MSNTTKRIISAIVMLLVLCFAAYFKTLGLLSLLLIVSILLIDEFSVNLIGISRKHIGYWISQSLFVLSYVVFAMLDKSMVFYDYFINTAVLLNSLLIFYLFFESMEGKFTIQIFRMFSFFIGLFLFFPIMSLSYVLNVENWASLLVILFSINIVTDTGAWFVGKNIGKNKLWKSVSPNKTIEGAIGGVVLSVIVSSLLIVTLLGKYNVLVFLSLIGLSAIAQIGDLVESKLKRQAGIKDSSNLIPGHGGIYDRIDSLLFTAPFFALMVKNLL